MIILPELLHAQWIPLIVNHLWQSTIFTLAAWLLTLVVKKNRARIRYSLWMLASMKFLLPFSLLIKVGERLQSHSSLAEMPGFSTAINGFTEPFSGSVAVQPTTPTAVSAAAQSVVQAHSDVLPMVLLAIWAFGALFLFARWGVRWLRIRRIVLTATPIDKEYAVPVRSVPGRLEPGIFGIFRPVLLLPEGIMERLSPAQLDAIVAHEIYHVRRRDNLTAALHMLVEVVFWFYPLVWWIGAGLMKERERACDEAVVESHSEVLTYAEGILNVCKTYVETPINCVSGVMGSDLKERISLILSGSVAGKLNLRRKLLLALAAVLAVAVPITTGVIHTAQVKAQAAEVDELKYQLDATEKELEMARRQLADEIARKDKTSNAPPPLPTTPEGEKMVRIGLKNGYNQTYSPLFKEMNLSPEKIDQLKELLADQEIARTKSILELDIASTKEDRKNIQKQLEEKNNQIYEALEALLGSDDFQAFESYKDRIQDRQVVQELSKVLSFDDPLTGDQNKSLLESLYNKRKNTYSQLGYNEEDPSGFWDMNDYGISNRLEIDIIVYDEYFEAVEEAGLSESQESQLKEYLEERQAVLTSKLEREARVASGEIDLEEADAEEMVMILN